VTGGEFIVYRLLSKRFLSAAMSAVVLALALPSRAERPFDFDTTPGKLPKDVRPLAYRIHLAPDLDKLTFVGDEQVDIDVAKPTDTVILNAVGLDFRKVALQGEDGAQADVTVDDKRQTASLHFPHALVSGRHTLAIAYSGKISAQPAGIYYADYDAPGGRKRMLTTQFEATDARRMFPGWDEPSFKASFTLSAILPSGFMAISNMPIAHEAPAGPGKKLIEFATTPRMSSYLLVLVAGEMDRIDGTANGTDVGVDTIAGKSEQGRYALDAATKILPYYNDYFGVKYPLPKLDLIAIPGNFAAGAMENWGGITYIDSALLFDPETSTPRTREYIFKVIAHEMAHQWSGDLVTMAWWDNIWLNEGFASWMEEKATDHFNPSWHIWLRAHNDKESAMATDARPTTHPIQQRIADESEADSAFDNITYEKGESFIRMLETYLGPDTFRDGMRRYMKAHAYSNATTADLWAALEEASGKPVAKIAAGFTEQPGVPLVHVATRCDNGSTVATLTQDRFTVHDPSASKLSWHIPVMIGRPGDAAPKSVLLADAPQTVNFKGCGAPVKANWGDVGYYRVEYGPTDLAALDASFAKLSAADRVNLIADLYAMVEAGRADAGSYLDLTRALGGETELVVWTEVADAFREIDDLEHGSPDREAFRAYARSVLRPALKRIGWDAKPGEGDETPMLRSMLIRALGRYGDADTIAEARQRFAAFVKNPSNLSPNLQDAVISVVGHAADQATYDQLHRLGRAASGTEAKLRFYNALGSASDPSLVEQTVKIALTDEVPNGRVNRYLAAAADSSDDPDLVWRSFLPERKSVEDKLTARQRDTLLPVLASASSDPKIAAELQALPEAQSSSGAKHEAAKAVEEIGFKAEYRTRLLPSVAHWLKTHGGGGAATGRTIQ
jgi:aminopeptidase N